MRNRGVVPAAGTDRKPPRVGTLDMTRTLSGLSAAVADGAVADLAVFEPDAEVEVPTGVVVGRMVPVG